MTKKYKILGKYIKDMSSETPNIETYIFVRDQIAKYQLGIDITSEALKNKMIEVNTKIKFEDNEESKKKSYFEINFASIVKIDDEIKYLQIAINKTAGSNEAEAWEWLLEYINKYKDSIK